MTQISSFFRNGPPDRHGVGAAHAKVEHGNHRNSFKTQKGSWLKARNLDTVKKARTDTSDDPNKTTKSVDVTSIFSGSKSITVRTSNPIAGNLKHHLRDWQKITNDPWVLEAILGYRIQFAFLPIQMLKEVLEQNHWMGKVDLKDAYLTAPIHHSHTGYLKFLWKGKAYKFLCLPFGLASAPRTFTKILKLVANFLRTHSVKMLVYIDDILVTADTKVLGNSYT